VCQKVEERDVTTYNEVPQPLPSAARALSFACSRSLARTLAIALPRTRPHHFTLARPPAPSTLFCPPDIQDSVTTPFPPSMNTQVADELVKEFKLDPSITFDEKNIRRRIYDALNVLMAMDIITRDKKNIR